MNRVKLILKSRDIVLYVSTEGVTKERWTFVYKNAPWKVIRKRGKWSENHVDMIVAIVGQRSLVCNYLDSLRLMSLAQTVWTRRCILNYKSVGFATHMVATTIDPGIGMRRCRSFSSVYYGYLASTYVSICLWGFRPHPCITSWGNNSIVSFS